MLITYFFLKNNIKSRYFKVILCCLTTKKSINTTKKIKLKKFLFYLKNIRKQNLIKKQLINVA